MTDEEVFDYLETGDKLWKRLSSLDLTYSMGVWLNEDYTWRYRHADKKEILKVITEDLEIINDRIRYFSSTSGYPPTASEDLEIEEKRIKELQTFLVSAGLGKPYAEIQPEALQSYKQLKEDYLKFKEDVKNTPDREFGRGRFYLNPR